MEVEALPTAPIPLPGNQPGDSPIKLILEANTPPEPAPEKAPVVEKAPKPRPFIPPTAGFGLPPPARNRAIAIALGIARRSPVGAGIALGLGVVAVGEHLGARAPIEAHARRTRESVDDFLTR